GITSGIGGPPLALLYRNAPGATVRSTLAAIFLVGLTINIVALVISDTLTTTDLKIAGVLVAPLLVGVAISGPLRGRVEGPLLRQGILILAAFAALGLLTTTIWS
ncbi:MAG: sulfite exporter TauE/SafE family protein, partial [Acidimicrobiia bacterium]|nr:sulfite exporter TauE/SafE family protein [Acidimicrobiia bacterium]